VVHHVGRESFSDLRAEHVTVRVSREIPDLRCKSFVEEIRRSFRQVRERGDFRLVQYSVQSDHVHLIVEAHGVAEAWNALRYVLLNAHKHFWRRFGKKPPSQIDWASSGHHFEGWTCKIPGIRNDPPEVARPKSWLLREGWKRRGPINPTAIPGL